MSLKISGVHRVLNKLNKKDKGANLLKLEEYALNVVKEEWARIDNTVKVELIRNAKGFDISVMGKQVLFLEFGTGIRYSSVTHPRAGELGFGAGTYPGKGNWNNPKGWFYIAQDPDDPHIERRSKDGTEFIAHTYGNPAYAPTYLAGERIKAYMKERNLL